MTGGGGFVGGFLRPAVEAAWPNAERFNLTGRADEGARPSWRAVAADLADEGAMDRLIGDLRPDLVIHLAAQSSVGEGAANPVGAWRTNAVGPFALASALRRHAPDATMLFISSGEVYGASFNHGPARENTPLQPANAYARSKAAAEFLLSDILTPQQPLIVARPFNHTGPGQSRNFVAPAFAAQIAEIEAGLREPVLRVGNLDAERDFLDVRDVCAAYVRLLQAPRAPRRIFNIASGRSVKIRTILEILRGLSRTPFAVENDPARMRPSEIPVAVGNAEALEGATAWSAAIPLQETLRDVLDFWRGAVAEASR